MDIIMTARHFEMTPEIREHAHRRMEKLERYLGGVEDVHVILTTEKYRHIAEVALHSRGTEIVGRDESDDMLASIDRVVDRIERQIKRLKARRRSRKAMRRSSLKGPLAGAGLEPAGSAAEEEEEEDMAADLDEDFAPVVVRGEQYLTEPASVEEAIRALQERDDDWLLFRNAQTKKVALVHVRADGNYGLVEVPE